MKPSIPILLSFNAGYVDTAGFLALQGLFTAHVTGNFVTFAAAMVHGASGAIGKLLALPVFCAIIVVTRLLSSVLARFDLPVLRTMLFVKIALLAVVANLAVQFGPFADPDSAIALTTGMVMVAAMAIQNAVHRVHLAKAPPSTLMTGTSTQIMLDIADLLHGAPAAERPAIKARLSAMGLTVAAFALGCGMAALGFMHLGMWCFAAAPAVALVAALARIDAATPAAAR